MDKITPEQQKQLNKLGVKMLAKSFWTGMHHALMAIAMNIVLLMGVVALGGDKSILMVGAVVIGFFTFRRMHSIVAQDSVKFHEEAKKIIKSGDENA